LDTEEEPAVSDDNPGELRFSAGDMSDDQLAEAGRAILSEFKRRNAETTIKLRCPCCNAALKDWHEYKPTWSQVKFLFEAMELMQRAQKKHFHIKSTLSNISREHRDHTLVGGINNHYSKMMYLNLVVRCKEDGTPLPQFEYIAESDSEDPCFTIPPAAVEFVMGRLPLKPAIVRVHNGKILDVPELRNSELWIRDVYTRVSRLAEERETDWLNAAGQMKLHFPSSLLNGEEGVQGSLFDDEEDEEEDEEKENEEE
jgi:hypothetical protein